MFWCLFNTFYLYFYLFCFYFSFSCRLCIICFVHVFVHHVKHIFYIFIFLFFVLFLFLLFLCVFAEYHRQFTVRNKIMFLFLFYFYFRILPASCNIKRTPPGHECIWGPATPPQEKTTAANSCTRVFYILYVQNFVKRCASTGTYHEKSCSGGSWILD